MTVLSFVLLLLALICFVVAAVRRRVDRHLAVDLIALGLAFWVTVPFLKALQDLN